MGGSLAVVLLAAAWVATWRPQVDPDAWWHLAIGEFDRRDTHHPDHRAVQLADGGRPVRGAQLAVGRLLVGAWRAGGATGTSLLVVPVTALIVWLTWKLIGLVAPGVPPLGRAALVLVAVIAALPVWAPRAQTLDVAFVLATILVLARYLRLGDRRGLVVLPVLGLLWANLHGSAILALPGCVALAVLAVPIGARWEAWPRRALEPLVLAGLAGMAATVVNPYGAGLIAYPFDRDVASAFSPAIVEWRPPDLGAVELLPFRLLLAGLVRRRGLVSRSVARSIPVARSGGLDVRGARVGAVPGDRGPAAGDRARAGGRGSGPSLARPPGGAEVGGTGRGRGTAPSGRAMAPRSRSRRVAGIGVLAGWLIIDPPRQDAAIARRLPVAAVAAIDAGGCAARLLPSYGWAGYVIWSSGRQVGAYGNSAEGAVTEQARLEALATDPSVAG